MLVMADTEETVWFDETDHATLVYTTPEIQVVVWFQIGSAIPYTEQIALSLSTRGLAKARIALEPWGYNPPGKVMTELEKLLRAGGAEVLDESQLIEKIRLVKSSLKIDVIRQASVMADRAMIAARDVIKPGIMETEVEAAIMYSLMKDGCGYPGIRTMIASGCRAETHHSPATHRRIKDGGLIIVDFCSSLHRYHVNLNRTFSLGQPDQRLVDLMNTSSGSMDEIIAWVKPGDPWSKVQTIGDGYLAEQELDSFVWFSGGYALGISVTPDWVGSFFVSPLGGIANQPLKPVMVFNYENQFGVWENWPGGSGAAYIEPLLVSETGLEVLSTLPRQLIVITRS